MKKQYHKGDISKLLDIVAALRDPDNGCPWDLAQDFATIAPYTIEEAYEVADAIERRAYGELPDELGDLLFQVVLHARIGSDSELFSFTDVVESICDKMIRRHPHVFDEAAAPGGGRDDSEPGRGNATRDSVAASWEAIKRAEKPADQSVLDGVTLGLPALSRAFKLGRRASAVGFDWPAVDPVRAKIDEELAELDAAVDQGRDRIEAEIGDLLFSIVNYCRHRQIDPERALRRCNDRFVRRFNHVEDQVRDRGGDWAAFDSDALESFWDSAKKAESG
jgi:ATP diphosphatase